jgi:hypothetical protein
VLRVTGCEHGEMQSPGDVSEKLPCLQKRKTGCECTNDYTGAEPSNFHSERQGTHASQYEDMEYDVVNSDISVSNKPTVPVLRVQ